MSSSNTILNQGWLGLWPPVVIVGFRIIARVSEALPGRAIFSQDFFWDFPEFFDIFRYFPVYFGIFRDSSVYFVLFWYSSGFFVKGSARGGNPGPRAPPGI